MATPSTQLVHDYASKPYTAYALSALFLGASFVPPAHAALLPPFYQRFGFGLIFSGSGYVLGTGDVRNGSGIMTSWSLTYLLVNLRKSLRPPRSALSLFMTASTVASAALYGTEYFAVIPGLDINDIASGLRNGQQG